MQGRGTSRHSVPTGQQVARISHENSRGKLKAAERARTPLQHRDSKAFKIELSPTSEGCV
jgi:hypothetical protein